MKQKRFNVEQTVAVLKQAEAGVPLAELLRRAGIASICLRSLLGSRLLAS